MGIIVDVITGAYTIDVWALLTAPTVWTDYLRTAIVIIAIITATLFTAYLILRQLNLIKLPSKEGEIEYYSSNNPYSSIDQLLLKTKNEICFVGITLESLNHKPSSIKEAIKKVDIKILLPNENIQFMDEIEKIVYSQGTINQIKGTLAMLEKIKNDNEVSDYKSNLKIRKYNTFPTYTIIIVDRKDKDGFMLIEPYAYKITQEERKVFKIDRKNNNELFKTYETSFLRMWNESIDS